MVAHAGKQSNITSLRPCFRSKKGEMVCYVFLPMCCFYWLMNEESVLGLHRTE
ncbi:hypothetical protein LEMLEM_LOCUS3924 [Lemmus lemmus]